MNKLTFFALAIITTVLCFSCREDSITTDPGDIIPIDNNIETFIESNLNGLVLDDQGNPIQNVSVFASGEMRTTDENGVYRFENINLSDRGSLIKIEKDGYFNGFKFATGSPGQNSFVETILVTKTSQEFQSDTETTITTGSNASALFRANSIVDATGQPYNGTVKIYSHWYDPASIDLVTTMPGDLRGIDNEEQAVQLVTYGMMAIELESPSGEELQLAEGATAQLKFGIPSGSNANDYTTIPTWHLDEESGIWLEEGIATVEDNFLVAEVAHFSFWNCDVPFPLVTITGKLVSSDGDPLPYQTITVRDNTNGVTQNGTSNQSGDFRGKVPLGVDLSLYIENCDEEIKILDIGILELNPDLGEVTAFSSSEITITGTLVDCQAELVSNGYLILNNSTIIFPDNSSDFSFTFSHCSGDEIKITAYDIDNETKSEEIIISDPQEFIDFGSLLVCDDGTEIEFFNVMTPFGDFSYDQVDVALVDDKILYIYGINDNIPGFVSAHSYIKYNMDTDENHFSVYVKENSGSYEQPATIDLQMSQIGAVGDFVVGTFSSDGGQPKTGSFRLKIDRLAASSTISGTVWEDKNSNGLRESDELGIADRRINLAQENRELITNTYYPPVSRIGYSDSDGDFIIPGVIAKDRYYLDYAKRSSDMISEADKGSDDIDSDFFSQPNSIVYITEQFTIDEGVELSNFGLGIISDPLACSSEYLCCPTSGFLVYTLAGTGESPFQIIVTDESNTVVHNETYNNSPMEVFLEPDHDYTIVMEDATGAQCTSERFLPKYLNSLSGSIWVDSPSGTPNKIDDLDIEYEGLGIEMLDENNEVFMTTTSDVNGRYAFNQFPGGTYRIRVSPPVGFEFVEQGDLSEQADSHVDIDTGVSYERQIGGWDWDIIFTLNVGLKAQ